jgi:hypothetical protein
MFSSIYNLFCARKSMSKEVKKHEKLQSHGEQDPNLSTGAESEREKSSNRPGTGAYQKVKSTSSE